MLRTLAALLAFAATPALADLTAEEVLADHLNLLSGYGLIDMSTTGTTERPDGLTVDGFIGKYQDENTRVEILTPGMMLTENPDGSVQIDYADTLAVTINAKPIGKEANSATLTLKTTGLTHVVSGSPGDIQHDIAFDTLTLGEFTLQPPAALDEMNLSADFAIAGFASTIRLADTAPVRRSLDLDIAGLSFASTMLLPAEIGIDTPGSSYDAVGNGETDVTFTLSDLSTRIGYLGRELPRHSMSTTLGHIRWDQTVTMDGDEGDIEMTLGGQQLALSYDVEFDFAKLEDDILKALASGQNMSAALNFQSLDYDFEIDTPEGTFASVTSSGASENRFSISENGLLVFSETAASVFDMGGPDLGLPINSFGYSIGHTLIDFAMPIAPSEAPQPFRFRVALEDVATDDSIWNLFDPTGRIERAPAHLSFDLDGTTVLKFPYHREVEDS